MKRIAQRWRLWVIGLLAVCFLADVGAQAYVGSFSRMMADTYCYAANVVGDGLWATQQIWYNQWTGRFSFNLAESLTGWAGPRLVPFLPPLALFVWLAILVSLVYQLRLSVSRPVALGLSLLFSGLVLAVTLGDIPLVAQSLYWSSGLNNYIPPLILLTAYASLLVYACRRPTVSRLASSGLLLGAALLPFVSVGFSEIATAAQLAALGCLVVALWVYGTGPARRRLLPLSMAGLLGGVLALAIVVAAPGNRLRAAFFPPPPELPALLALAVKLTAGYLQSAWITHPGNLLAAVMIPGALAAWLLADDSVLPLSRRGLVRLVLWTPIVVTGLELAAFAVAAYGQSGSPPARAQIVPQYLLVMGLVVWGFAAGGLLRQAGLGQLLGQETYFWKLVVAGMLVLFGWRGLQLTQETLATAAVFGPYAHAWDETYRLIQSARSRGLARVSVPPLANVSQLEEAGPDPNNWVNLCLSRYSGLVVVANPPRPAPTPAEWQHSIRLDGQIGDVAQVQGYALDKDSLRAGETLSVTVYWQPEAISERPLTVFVHLYDPAVGAIAQVDTYPLQGQYPTTGWVFEHAFADTYHLTVPASFTASRQAEIVLGLYDLQTLQRVPVSGADAESEQAWLHFGQVRVNP